MFYLKLVAFVSVPNFHSRYPKSNASIYSVAIAVADTEL